MITDLNDTPKSLIEQARSLQGLARQRLLRINVSAANHQYLDWFTREVIDGEVEAQEWGRGGILVPEFSLTELLSLPAREILDPLHKDDSAPWQRVQFDSVIDDRNPYGGAPALLDRSLKYSWRPSGHVTKISTSAAGLLELTEITIPLRRWIAFRISLAIDLSTEHPKSLQRLMQDIGADFHSLSEDAQLAARGLTLESERLSADHGIWGFTGPDHYYTP